MVQSVSDYAASNCNTQNMSCVVKSAGKSLDFIGILFENQVLCPGVVAGSLKKGFSSLK